MIQDINKNIPQICGIKNCDTMKKAMAWLNINNIEYYFHDYKTSGINEFIFSTAIEQHGWDTVINKRGTSWRQLSDATKNQTNNNNVIELARTNPSLIKRPLLYMHETVYLGFNVEKYQDVFQI